MGRIITSLLLTVLMPNVHTSPRSLPIAHGTGQRANWATSTGPLA
jgi:hypothetical protein